MQRIEKAMSEVEQKLLFMNSLRKAFLMKNNHQYNEKKLTINEKGKNECLVIVANAPSINQMWNKILDYKSADYMCVNFFLLNKKKFLELKPRYYCAIDKSFFEDTENAKLLFDTLNNNVDWEMLFIHYMGQNFPSINMNIKEKWINNNYYFDGPKKLSMKMYDENYMTVYERNVVVAAIYSGILMGYKKIFIYGMELSGIHKFYVDERNHIIMGDSHHYEDSECKIDLTERDTEYAKKGIIRVLETSLWGFQAFRDLRKYADLRGTKIYNCTPDSYVDAFERILD